MSQPHAPMYEGEIPHIPNIPQMPRNEQAEVAVIAAMLIDSEALIYAAEFLDADDFFVLPYRLIYGALRLLHEVGMPIDFVTLSDKLTELGQLEKVGGLQKLAEIASSSATAANFKSHIEIIIEKSLLRKVIQMSGELTALGYAQQLRAEDVLDMAEKMVYAISQRRRSLGFVHIREALLSSIETIEQAYRQGSKITGIESGFKDLDLKTAGFHPSDFVLIAARPSMGKTAIALNIAANAAIKGNVPCAIFSLEMSKEQLAARLIASEARIDANKLRTGQLEANDWFNITQAIGPLSQAPLYLDDTPGITLPQLRSKCRKLKMERGLGLIMIDYLQLMSSSGMRAGGRYENRQQEISEISRALKALAREMDAPVIALSQLSRAPEARADRRPILSDLRESGAIEQDADLVCFIYRDEYYNPESEKRGIAEVIIAKQRNGETGTVELMYQSNYVRFVNLA